MGSNLPLELRSYANLISDRAAIRPSTRVPGYSMAQARRKPGRKSFEDASGRITTEPSRSKLSSFTPRYSRNADSLLGDQEKGKEVTGESSQEMPEGPIVVCDDLDALLQVCVAQSAKGCSFCV
jgi:hypothetical protein